jgi:hypothetical protein
MCIIASEPMNQSFVCSIEIKLAKSTYFSAGSFYLVARHGTSSRNLAATVDLCFLYHTSSKNKGKNGSVHSSRASLG